MQSAYFNQWQCIGQERGVGASLLSDFHDGLKHSLSSCISRPLPPSQARRAASVLR